MPSPPMGCHLPEQIQQDEVVGSASETALGIHKKANTCMQNKVEGHLFRPTLEETLEKAQGIAVKYQEICSTHG